jgi:tetratricopeptide (TPR) repeat protein
MQVTLDQTLLDTINSYAAGQADVFAVTAHITTEDELELVLGEIFKMCQGQAGTLGIPLNRNTRVLYEELSTMRGSIEKAVAPILFGAAHNGDAPAPKVSLSSCLSHVLETTKFPLTEENFRTLAGLRRDNSPLEVVLHSFDAELAVALVEAQKALGPIHSLTLALKSEPEEEDDQAQETLTSLLNACPQASAITLYNMTDFTDSVVEKVEWPKRLRTLKVIGGNITKAGLTMLCQKCPLLTELHLREPLQLTHKDLQEVEFPNTLQNLLYDPYWGGDNKTLDCEGASKHARTMRACALLERESQDVKTEALNLLLAVRQEDPHYLPANLALAELYRTGAFGAPCNMVEAQRIRQELVQRCPNNPRVLALHARFLLQEGKLEDAHAHAESAYHREPEDDFVLATFADICRRMDNQPLAVTLVRRARRINPHNELAITCRGILKENNEDARDLFELALGINMHNQTALLELAFLKLQTNSVESNRQARDYLATLLQANAKHPTANFEMAKLCMAGTRLGIEKDEKLAYHYFQKALQADPNNHEINATFGEFLRTSENYNNLPQAVRLLEEAAAEPVLKRSRAAGEAETSLASIYMEDCAGSIEDRVRALQLCEQAYAKDPDDPFLLSMLGELLLTIDPERGIRYLEYVIEQHQNVPALIALGQYYSSNEPDKTVELLNQALGENDQDISTLIAVARYQLSLNNFADATSNLNCALAIDPNSPQALVLKARILIEEDKMAEAAEIILRVVRSTKFGIQTKQELVAILCENPDLLDGQRGAILEQLFN